MKKNLYLVRHGETLFNRRNLIQGVVNAPLVLEGVAQALHTKKVYFEKNSIDYDSVVCSPEGRCVQTTELLTDKPYQEIVDLHEMCFGKLEGVPAYLGPAPDEFDTYFASIGGETVAQVAHRMNGALEKVMLDPERTNVLAVAHGCANLAFCDLWKPFWKIEPDHVGVLSNCSVLHFVYDTDTKIFTLVDVFNEDYHTEDFEQARKMHQALIV